MSESLATGAPLTPETWADFVNRLNHHCRGSGVENHCTAHAIFIVEARRLIYGIDGDYTDNTAIIFDDSVWHTTEEYWNDCDETERENLNTIAEEAGHPSFMQADEYARLEIIKELDDHTVTGWDERWEHVGTHFTREAAEAFIARKKHDYRAGLRVYVEAQPYAWEFEAIKEAIMDGRLVLKEGGAA